MELFQTLVDDSSVNFTEVHFDIAISVCEKAGFVNFSPLVLGWDLGRDTGKMEATLDPRFVRRASGAKS